jgi:hypothetical protein
MKLFENYGFERNLIRSNTFENEIVIVDGQGRSGKNLIAVLLSTMNRVEKMRLDSQFDYIPRYYFMGKMSLDAAIAALQTESDEKYYYNSISRDVNFRPTDYSGVLFQGKRLEYLLRLFQPADEKAVKRLADKRPIFQEMTHDGLHIADLYFRAFGSRLKIIHVFRDPVGNIYEQNVRGFGSRIGKDPRELQLTHEWNGQSVPIIAIGREDEYLRANSTERLVLMVDIMFRANLKGFNDLGKEEKRRVMFIEFEKFVVEPQSYLNQIESFIGEKFGRSKQRILNRENCPRIIDVKTRQERHGRIYSQIRPHFRERFDHLIEDYDARPWVGLGFENE